MKTSLARVTVASILLGMVATVVLLTAPVASAEEIDSIELGDAILLTAEVLAIDNEFRIVTLLGPEGDIVDVAVGEEARNFNQIRVGDEVNIAYYESVALYLGERDQAPEVDAGVAVTRAAEGEKPAGLVVGVVDVSVTILAIDLKERTATLELPDGEIVVVPVAEAVRSLDTLEVGDTVHACLTKAVAISVKKPE